MRAELDQDGTLIVGADTPIEAFALARWPEVFRNPNFKSEFIDDAASRANFTATIVVDMNVNGGGNQ